MRSIENTQKVLRQLEIHGIITHLDRLWKKHPELRLGQLLINLTNDNDLFYIKDDTLLKRIKKGF